MATLTLVMIPLIRMYMFPPANKTKELYTAMIPADSRVICSKGAWTSALYCCYFNQGKLYDSVHPQYIDAAFLQSHPGLSYYCCLPSEVPATLRAMPVITAGDLVIISLK
jgi:hypothetical protein